MALHVPAHHTGQRDHLRARGPPRPDRRRHHDRIHRRRGAGSRRLLLRASDGHDRRGLGRGLGSVLRAVPGLDLQLRGADVRPRHPSSHRDADVRDPAHRGRTRRCAGIPHRHVQHRRSRADADGIRRGRLGGLLARPAVGPPHDRCPHRRAGSRGALGGHRRCAEGLDRRARGDRHDHAQLRRVLPDLVDAAHTGPAAGAGFEQPEDAADEGHGDLPRAVRSPVQPALRIHPRHHRDDRGVVDPRAGPASGSSSAPSARTRTPRAWRASTSRTCTSSAC